MSYSSTSMWTPVSADARKSKLVARKVHHAVVSGRREIVGKQLDRGVGDCHPSGRGRSFEKEKGGSSKRGGEKIIIDLTEYEEEEEEEEEEKEKEEGKESRRWGVEGSRKNRVGWKYVSKEDHRSTFPRHWPRPVLEESQENPEDGQEEVEQIKGDFIEQRVIHIEHIERLGGRSCLGGQEQAASNCGHRPRSFGSPRNFEHERILDADRRHRVGRRPTVLAPSVGAVPSHLHGGAALRRSEQRVLHPMLGGGPLVAASRLRGDGCASTALEEPGIDSSRHKLDNQSETGVGPPQQRQLGGGPKYKLRARKRDWTNKSFPPVALSTRRGPKEKKSERIPPQKGKTKEREGKGKGDKEALYLKEAAEVEERYEAPRGVEAVGSVRKLPEKEAEEMRSADMVEAAVKKVRRKGNREKRAMPALIKQKVWMKKAKEKERRKKKGLRVCCDRERVGVGELPFSQRAKPAVAATAVGSVFHTVGQQAPILSRQGSHALGLGQDRLREKQSGDGMDGDTLGSVSRWPDSRVDAFFARHCKTMSTGMLFPLPSSPCTLATIFPGVSQTVRCVLRCLVVSLNSLNGEGLDGPSVASDFQEEVLKGLLEDCSRVAGWVQEEPHLSWKDFFRTKGVDYRGDEILTAQPMRWENVSPALPKEVGTVPLESVLEFGSKHYVEQFEEYLLAEEDQVSVKPTKVMVPPQDWSLFCSQLLKLGVFSRVHEDDLHVVKGQKVLNGLFGVSKREFEGNVEVMQIIMNMIPVNNVCRGIEGDISTLPSWAGMTPLHLQPHEQLLVSSEDVRAFFYIFKVPVVGTDF